MVRVALQLALDVPDLELSERLARSAGGTVDRIEVGTPLLRRYGMESIVILRRVVKNSVLVADCKIMDCGAVETILAADAGADGVIVQAAAPRPTVEAACEAAASRGLFVMVDGLGVRNPEQLLEKTLGLPVDHLIIHRGKDEQMLDGPPPIAMVHWAASLEGVPPIAVAGGISPGNVSSVVAESPVDLLIVGGAIASSRDPLRVVSTLRRVCDDLRGIR
jgi:3-keto-L-gulonate-6-phosphate decarboxylase